MVDRSRFFDFLPSLSTIELRKQLERIQKLRHSCRCHTSTRDIGMSIWTLFKMMWLVIAGHNGVYEDQPLKGRSR